MAGRKCVLGPTYFLSGDSFPDDAHVDIELQCRLKSRCQRWISQGDIYDPRLGGFQIYDFASRASHFETFLCQQASPLDTILMGRSSGARLASWYASRHRVRAVVCLCYPFKSPDKGREPERYEHLARLTVPTLIIQGSVDDYGGRNILSDFTLSPAIKVKFVEGADHAFLISPQSWDVVTEDIISFCNSADLARISRVIGVDPRPPWVRMPPSAPASAPPGRPKRR
jgi:pimeloyl-ACP methyl ester carboxylesterase